MKGQPTDDPNDAPFFGINRNYSVTSTVIENNNDTITERLGNDNEPLP